MLLSAVSSKTVVEHLLLNNTLTTWRFLIKAPYQKTLCYMCDQKIIYLIMSCTCLTYIARPIFICGGKKGSGYLTVDLESMNFGLC